MRLISLSANKDSFHSVNFNQRGLNLIIGRQKETGEKAAKRTYNGVGKSLVVALIHYCLGSKRVKAFEEKLPEWEFQLQFEHGGEKYCATRATEKPKHIVLNGESLSLTDFNKDLESLLFPAVANIPFLSYRSLIPSFIRRNREAYASFDSAGLEAQEFQKQLRVAYLLGLDVDLALEKRQLRNQITELDRRIKDFQKDPIFKEFLGGESDALILLEELAAKIRKSESRLSTFQLAEDYYAKQQEANAVTTDLQAIRNKREVLTRAIEQIEKSLKVQPDLKPDRVMAVYQEATVHFPDAVKRRIDDVLLFRERLIDSRNAKLAKEKRRLLKERDTLSERVTQLSVTRDALLRYLGEHQALDEYLALSNELGEVRAQEKKVQDYQKLLVRYKSDKARAILKLKKENVGTNDYLEDVEDLLESNMKAFVSLSSQFYEEKPGGIAVKNNEGDNQLRFDIVARIEDDASDGINEVKIFCFDMMVLKQKHNHGIDFLFHDSRLFSDMDHRQRATSLHVVLEESRSWDYQYVATLNEDQLHACRECLDTDDWQKIESSIILELTDESPKSKLLGVEVDMRYDE